jgi:hypothetical protein
MAYMIAPPSPIYTNSLPIGAEERAFQLQHLALIGLAATDSNLEVRNLDGAMGSLFEVMARLAEELAGDVEYLQHSLRAKTAKADPATPRPGKGR